LIRVARSKKSLLFFFQRAKIIVENPQTSQMQATGASKRLLISVAENQSSFASLLEKDGSANGVVMKLNNTGKDVRRRVFLSNDSKYLQWEPSKKKDGFG
jgi:hypothetical protein